MPSLITRSAVGSAFLATACAAGCTASLTALSARGRAFFSTAAAAGSMARVLMNSAVGLACLDACKGTSAEMHARPHCARPQGVS